eukprot:COSAG02_NODE_19535_length_877_cov_1.317481_2_plen_110_part_01
MKLVGLIRYGQYRSDPDVIKEDLAYFQEHQNFVEADVEAQEHDAATKLQAAARGRQDRLRHERRLRAKRRHEEVAATKIAAVYRGRRTREGLAAKQTAAEAVENLVSQIY